VNQLRKSVLGTLVAGLLVLAPIYLAVLLVLKAMRSLSTVMGPLAKLLPAWLPGAQILSLLLVVIVCFLTGLGVRTGIGHAIWEQIEKSLLQKLPGYPLLRSLTQRLAGESEDRARRPALAEIEDALVPAFIIEELDDGRLTVFVPSGAHSFRWCGLRSQPNTRAFAEHPFYPGNERHLPVGIRLQESCCCHRVEESQLIMNFSKRHLHW
jgi:hypothetical protein